jgi:hypothetical protein
MSMRRGCLRAGLLLALVCLGLISAGLADATGGSEPSAQFLKDEGAGKYVRFGVEASSREREAASKVVTKDLKAREAAHFATQCETLTLKAIAKIPGAETRKSCPAALREYAEPLAETKQVRRDTLKGPVAAMRIKGVLGYALFHDSDGSDYAVPLEKEGGSWKVGSIVTIEL